MRKGTVTRKFSYKYDSKKSLYTLTPATSEGDIFCINKVSIFKFQMFLAVQLSRVTGKNLVKFDFSTRNRLLNVNQFEIGSKGFDVKVLMRVKTKLDPNSEFDKVIARKVRQTEK